MCVSSDAAVHVADRVEPVARAHLSSTSIGLPGSSPTVSRPRSSVRGRRPTATSSSSPRSGPPLVELDLDLAVARPHRRWPSRPRCTSTPRSRSAAPPARRRTAPRAASRRSPPSTSVTWEPSVRPGLRHLDADHAAAEDHQPLRHLLAPWWPRGWSTASPRAARRSAGCAEPLPVATTTASPRDQRVVAHLDPALAVEAAAPRTSSIAVVVEPGLHVRVVEAWMISSRRSSTARTSRSPVTASRTPGMRRTSASSSPGRSSAFEGMHA